MSKFKPAFFTGILMLMTMFTLLYWYFFGNDDMGIAGLHKIQSSSGAGPNKFQSFSERDNRTMSLKQQNGKNRNNDGRISTEESLVQVHIRRQNHVLQLCPKVDVSKTNLNETIPWPVLYSAKHKLACRLTPKIGSTFMVQLFSLLKRQETLDVFSSSRKFVHKTYQKRLVKIFTSRELQSYHVMIMGRNPYSRLYSAYVDKVFLVHNPVLAENVHSYSRKNESSCQFETTFQNFLDYVLDRTIKGHTLGDHYLPLFSATTTKYICHLARFTIGKQETFADDVEYALQTSAVDQSIRDAVHDILHSKNSESNINSLTKDLYFKVKNFESTGQLNINTTCFNWSIVASRLWKSFKIQGYIHETMAFPVSEFQSKIQMKDEKLFINVAINAMKRRYLSSEEKAKQRKGYLMNAYRQISTDTIEKIKKVFKEDFQVYQYDKDVSKT